MVDRVGQRLGSYQIERFLDQGGFGEIYLAEHVHLGTKAAIKILKTQIGSEDVGQFQNEARMIARLIHPHIVRVLEYNVEESTGTPFFVMDYAPDGTVRKHYPKGTRVPLATIVSYVKQIADALQYAHNNRVIHRDVKPENILVGPHGEILLSDFGIALIVQTSSYRSTQEMTGTIAYMAPEQIQGHPGPASDQYALAVVVYEWLCGEKPFSGSFTEIAAKHYSAPPPPLRARVPTIPQQVEHVVMRALSKDPQQRFASVQEFAEALELASGIVPATGGGTRSKPNDGSIEWTIRIGKPTPTSIIATLVGIILYSLVVSRLYPTAFSDFVDRAVQPDSGTGLLFTTLGAVALFGLANAIPLFFGATFGSYVGMLVGGLGFFIGTYFCPPFRQAGYYSSPNPSLGDYFDFLSPHGGGNWFVLLSIAVASFFVGLAIRRTKGRYNTLYNLVLAHFYGIAGIALGVAFMLLTFDLFIVNGGERGFSWLEFLLIVLVLPGPIVLPVLLRAYDNVTQRLRSRQQRDTVFAK